MNNNMPHKINVYALRISGDIFQSITIVYKGVKYAALPLVTLILPDSSNHKDRGPQTLHWTA